MSTKTLEDKPSPTPRKIVLASTSPFRAALLQRLGLPFAVAAPHVEEEERPEETPEAMALRLAARKARSLADDFPEAIIIGADQVAACRGVILRKPLTAENALAQLQRLRGEMHTLHTAFHLLDCQSGAEDAHCTVARLWLRPELSDAMLRQYIASDRPLDCAGAYKLESRGIALFSRVECDDWTAITGLPLLALVHALRDLGLPVF